MVACGVPVPVDDHCERLAELALRRVHILIAFIIFWGSFSELRLVPYFFFV